MGVAITTAWIFLSFQILTDTSLNEDTVYVELYDGPSYNNINTVQLLMPRYTEQGDVWSQSTWESPTGHRGV